MGLYINIFSRKEERIGGLDLNKIKRNIYRFRARIYAKLPRDKSMLKVKLLLFLLVTLCFCQIVPWNKIKEVFGKNVEGNYFFENFLAEKGSKENTILEYASGGIIIEEKNSLQKEDEQKGVGDSIISYASGSEELVKREQEEKIVVVPSPTIELLEEEKNEQGKTVTTSGLNVYFSPACYPQLDGIIGKKYLLENLLDLDYLKETFYIVNTTTKMTKKEFNVQYFLERDLSIEKKEEPQILIYHTHGSESFVDSRSGESADTVVGMGDVLAQYLTEKHGYQVLHDTTLFDMKDGKNNRNYAYNDALTYMEQLLKKYPSIEVIIDLHRDAGAKRVATIQGKKVAKVMLFNGLCRNTQGVLSHLPNKNLLDNLAFSFQMKLLGDEMYPGLMNKIFLKDYRYNMHLAERYLLIELGTDQNTVEEARNAMEPLADVLAQVLGK